MFKNLVIRRPLAVIDVETTGTDVRTDRIVEIAVLKFLPDGTRRPCCRRVNPGIPIPEAATAIHGIRDEDVQGEPRFDQIAARLVRFLDNCDLCGFNLKRFDLKLILAELERSGQRLELDGRSIIDPCRSTTIESGETSPPRSVSTADVSTRMPTRTRRRSTSNKFAHDRANEEARDRSFQAFDNIIVGQSVVLDSWHNAHGTISNDYAEALVKAHPERFQYVPTEDYVKGIDY